MNQYARTHLPILTIVLTGMLMLTGCAGPVGRRKVTVAPQYTGLEGKRVAVLVSVDDLTLAQYPTFRESMTRAVSAGVATSLPGTKVIDPADVEKFQRERPGWVSTPYNKLTSRLDVDRLLVIDVVDFHTREMGNAAVWKGELIAHVNVAERERDDNRFAMTSTLTARHAPGSRLPTTDGSTDAVLQGTIYVFRQQLLNLFREHETYEEIR